MHVFSPNSRRIALHSFVGYVVQDVQTHGQEALDQIEGHNFIQKKMWKLNN